MIDREERLAYLTVAMVPGIGPARLAALRSALGSFRAALAAPVPVLRSVPTMTRAAATAVHRASPALAEGILEQLRVMGGVLLTPDDEHHPTALTQLPEPPPLLFALGRLELLERIAVAVVGSRQPTTYGRDAARLVARSAVGARLVVVSGMARGLDAVAHQAALDAGGGSIGVLGNGLGVVYPAANRALYERMSRAGLLLTEHPPGERPNAGSFPVRNRIIAALARVTVVVEAAMDSGALQTADHALGLGREVMAVPGQITSSTSTGTNRLLRDGATHWLEPDDLLGLIPEIAPEVRTAFRNATAPEVVAARLRDELRRLYQRLDGNPRSADELAHQLSAPPASVLALLSELEIDGVAERRAGGYVRLS
ncbi:MAG: DNA-processing protein DprA [Gemmatimonadales bacterium]